MKHHFLWELTDYSNAAMPPRYLSDITAWHGHIPFAFFVTQVVRPSLFVELGVHAGDSYMAFCQGLDQPDGMLLKKAFGIDTFKGDEHSGPYEENMYQMVSDVHDPLYGKFSTLVPRRFEEAVSDFEVGSIDLLHLDGLHTYEAVSRDLEMWLPKMSSRGVLLMHDTSVISDPTFGVWQKWGELRREYPHFEFYHSNGLGVLLVGNDAPEILYKMGEQDKTWQGEWIREYFKLFSDRVYAMKKAEKKDESK